MTYRILLLALFLITNLTFAQWTQKNIGTSEDLSSIYFQNTNIGWIVGGNGKILKTTDGGDHWIVQILGLTEWLSEIRFFNNDIGWIVGRSGAILKTTNGGETWIDKTYSLGANYNSVFFVTEQMGWIVGNDIIIKTTDGGENWSEQMNPGYDWWTVVFTDTITGYVVGINANFILQTTDGGENWNPSYPFGMTFCSIYFINKSVGWFCGSEQNIWKTTDGGEDWTQQRYKSTGPKDQLYSFYFLDENIGWVVGQEGVILHTTNGGLNWLPQMSGTIKDLTDIIFTDSDNGIIVGTESTYLTTINGGGLYAITELTANAQVGNQILEVANTNGFSVGDDILINPGKANEEVNRITGFGSILLETPLQYDHQAGEIVMTANPSDVEEDEDYPTKYLLENNYPNPFNPSTNIKYTIPHYNNVVIKIFDVLGKEIETLVNEEKAAGTYELTWYAEGLPSGVYFYQLRAGSFVETKKMVLLR